MWLMRRDAAARAIGTMYRGYAVRKSFNRQPPRDSPPTQHTAGIVDDAAAARCIQRWWRAVHVRRAFVALVHHTVYLQSMARMRAAQRAARLRREMGARVRACAVVMRFIRRHWLARRRTLLRLVVRLQRFVRKHVVTPAWVRVNPPAREFLRIHAVFSPQHAHSPRSQHVLPTPVVQPPSRGHVQGGHEYASVPDVPASPSNDAILDGGDGCACVGRRVGLRLTMVVHACGCVL